MIGFRDILGQERAVARLQSALAADRLPHALLLTGPKGVGRRTTARVLSATLLCDQPVEQPNGRAIDALDADAPLREPCGRCESCRLMQADTHPDFHLVYKELAGYHPDREVRQRKMQDLGIPVIQHFLIAPACRAAQRGGRKVFLVREAELMSREAQNALLKTLEEPPPGVTILLLAPSADQLLPTTISRCRQIPFGPLPVDLVADKLVADAGLDRGQAHFWAMFTAGSLGESLRLASGEMYDTKTELVSEFTRAACDRISVPGDDLVKRMESLASEEIARSHRPGQPDLARTVANRRAAATLIRLIASLFRDAMTLASGSDAPLTNADQQPCVRQIAERFPPTRLADVLGQLSRYEWMLWRNVNAKTVWDNLAIACASPSAIDL